MPTPSATDIQANNKATLDSTAAMMKLSMGLNQLANLLSQLITGSNYSPTQHGTIGALSYLGAQTSFAQMLGVDNPVQRINAAKDISGMTYGYANDPAAILHQSRTLKNLNAYASVKQQQGKSDPYQISQMQQAAAARYLVASGNLSEKEMANLGDQNSSGFKKMDSAAKIISVSQKVMGFGDDLEAIMGTAQAISGSNNFEQAADTYIKFIEGLVASGMSLAERQQTVAMTMKMASSIQAKTGYSASGSASIARNAVGGASVAAINARRKGITDFDVKQTANDLAALELEADQTDEGQSKLVAARVIAQSGLSKDKQKALLEQVKSGSPQEVENIMKANGLSESYNIGRKTAANDPSWLRSANDKDTQDAINDVGNANAGKYINKSFESYFQQQVAEHGTTSPEYKAAMKVREALNSGNWDGIDTKILDQATPYIGTRGRNAIMGQKGKIELQQKQGSLKNINAIMKEGSQFSSSLVEGDITTALTAEGLDGKDIVKDVAKDEKSQLKAFQDAFGIKDAKEAEVQHKKWKDAIQKEGLKGPTSVKGAEGMVTFDEKGNITKATDNKKYQEAKQKQMEAKQKEDPIGNILLAIKDLIDKIYQNQGK